MRAVRSVVPRQRGRDKHNTISTNIRNKRNQRHHRRRFTVPITPVVEPSDEAEASLNAVLLVTRKLNRKKSSTTDGNTNARRGWSRRHAHPQAAATQQWATTRASRPSSAQVNHSSTGVPRNQRPATSGTWMRANSTRSASVNQESIDLAAIKADPLFWENRDVRLRFERQAREREAAVTSRPVQLPVRQVLLNTTYMFKLIVEWMNVISFYRRKAITPKYNPQEPMQRLVSITTLAKNTFGASMGATSLHKPRVSFVSSLVIVVSVVCTGQPLLPPVIYI